MKWFGIMIAVMLLPAVHAVVLLGFGNNSLFVTDAVVSACQNVSYISDGSLLYGMELINTCQTTASASDTTVRYVNPLNLTFGAVQANEVESGRNWVFVDSGLRPDLDHPAVLMFKHHGFAAAPGVLRNGVHCNDCNLTFTADEIDIEVPGFSNYSLTFAQNFSVRDDPQPELKDKVYQVIDLGNSYRATDFACFVQIYGLNQNSQWILVQTNPQRDVQARLLGNPDPNQPETLGYFPTKNGVANTYFRGDQLTGYNDFEMVIDCVSNMTKLTYEEPISTRYSPAGRGVVSRFVWFTDGSNGAYVVLFTVAGIVLIFVLVGAWRKLRR